MWQAGVAWERLACEREIYNDGNRSTRVCGRDVDDLCLLASATEDVGHEVCRRCIAGHAGDILSGRLPLVSVWTGFAFLADHSDQCHHIASDGGDSGAQAALSRPVGC